jgi:trans-2,3-dihydro-3-hydroxyanthranilate isomerase
MKRRYLTVDVFTNRMFGGNPLAVVLDAGGLTTAQMQAIAAEFNYSETTFVLPPSDSAHTAHVRIFTPRTEVPFAGHPNVGTAFVLAQQSEFAYASARNGFVFEEGAGLVPLQLLRQDGAVVGAELRAPEALSRRSFVSQQDAASCLSLTEQDIAIAAHAPQVISVGLPFLAVEVVSREALSRARPNAAEHERLLPLDGADSVFAYWRANGESNSSETVLHARTFAPLDGVVEDPATGSANAAAISLLATLRESQVSDHRWRIHQGVDMGRPSLLLGRTIARDRALAETYIGGSCVAVLSGTFFL